MIVLCITQTNKITSLIELPNNGLENHVLIGEGDISNNFGVNTKKPQRGNSNHLNQTQWRKYSTMSELKCQ